jgi:uncharacterized protein (DUF1778 family)
MHLDDPPDDQSATGSARSSKRGHATARAKITARLTPELAAGLRRVAALEGRSVSDLIEDAVGRAFANASGDTEQAAIIARIDALARRQDAQDRSLETLFELTAFATRFAMSVAPAINPEDRAALDARGAERFANVASAIVARLAKGRSVWRDTFLTPTANPPAAAPEPVIAAEGADA